MIFLRCEYTILPTVDYNYLDLENGIGLDLIMSIVMFCICWGLIILKESKYHRIWKPKISEDVYVDDDPCIHSKNVR